MGRTFYTIHHVKFKLWLNRLSLKFLKCRSIVICMLYLYWGVNLPTKNRNIKFQFFDFLEIGPRPSKYWKSGDTVMWRLYQKVDQNWIFFWEQNYTLKTQNIRRKKKRWFDWQSGSKPSKYWKTGGIIMWGHNKIHFSKITIITLWKNISQNSQLFFFISLIFYFFNFYLKK